MMRLAAALWFAHGANGLSTSIRSLEEPALFRRKAEDRRNVHCSDPIADHLWTRIRIAAIESAPTMHLGLDGIHAN